MADYITQVLPAKRQFHPVTDSDTLCQRHTQPVSDSDTFYPPKKRALFDYNREQARRNYLADKKTQLQYDERFGRCTVRNENQNTLSHSNENTNRHDFFSAKLKMDRNELQMEIRPRSDSLHSINSQYSEMSSVDSLNSTSRETSPVTVYELDSSHTETYGQKERDVIKDHETPERNPVLVLNGSKANIQKPLFNQNTNNSNTTETVKPLVSKTLFPLNQENIDTFEQIQHQQNIPDSGSHERGRINIRGQVDTRDRSFRQCTNAGGNNIPNENCQSFQYSNIPLPESPNVEHCLNINQSYTQKDIRNTEIYFEVPTSENFQESKVERDSNESNEILGTKCVVGNVFKTQLNPRNKSRNKGRSNKINESSKVLGDVTNSLNIKKKPEERNPNVQEIYKCSVCNKVFRQSGNFHSHMQLHMETNRICKCGICGVDYDDSDSLQAHMRSQHTGSHPYKCEKCNREFSQFNNLRRHLRVHREKTFKCNLCDRVFNEEFYLKMHVGTHTGERVYTCGVCNNPFPSSHELKSHVKTHSPSELHVCNVCGKAFSKACVLRQHKKAHSGERPHKCALCTKTFIHRHHLTMHMRSHEENKPYTCDICNKVFSQTSHLYKHLRQHEEENLENNPNSLRNTTNAARKKSVEKKMDSRTSLLKNNADIPNRTEELRKKDTEVVKGMYHRPFGKIVKVESSSKLSSVKENNFADGKRKEMFMEDRYSERLHKKVDLIMNPTSERAVTSTSNSEKLGSLDLLKPSKWSLPFTLNDEKKEELKTVKVLCSKELTEDALQRTRQMSTYTDSSLSASSQSLALPVSQAIPTKLPTISSTSSLKLPSFDSITSNLKDSQPNWPLTNSQITLPYYLTPGHEQSYYPYGYGCYQSFPYTTGSMYMTYSAQMQTYYNMMYYNSKAAVESHFRSLEIGQSLENTAEIKDDHQKYQISKRELDEKVIFSKNGHMSDELTKTAEENSQNTSNSSKKETLADNENVVENNQWCQNPELTTESGNSHRLDKNKEINQVNRNYIQETMSDSAENSKNPLLVTAVQENLLNDDLEAGMNEHLMKLIKLKDKFINADEKQQPFDKTESLIQDTAPLERFHENSGHTSDTEDITVVPNKNSGENKRYENDCQKAEETFTENNNAENIISLGKENFEVNPPANDIFEVKQENDKVTEENLEVVMNDRLNVAQRIVENVTVADLNALSQGASEHRKFSNSETDHFEHKKNQQTENYICCDTCNFTFCNKGDLKTHFLQNPKCFSKVCETSKITEEFGWQLLDYYLASLGVKKSDESTNKQIDECNNQSLENVMGIHSTANLNTNDFPEKKCKGLSDTVIVPDLRMPGESYTLKNDRSNINYKDNYETNNSANEKICEDIHVDGVLKEYFDNVDKPEDKFIAEKHLEIKSKTDFGKGTGSACVNGMLFSAVNENENEFQANISAVEGSDCITTVEKADTLVNRENEISPVAKKITKLNEVQKLEFPCQYCSEMYGDEKTLQVHMQIHSTDRPFLCSICKRSFTHQHNLKRHMMAHSNKSVECTICGRGFKETFYLQMHMKVHSEEHSQKCEICGEKISKSDLSNHINSHIGPIVENPTYAQIAERVEELLNANVEVLDLSKNDTVSKETLMKMNVEELKIFLMKGRNNGQISGITCTDKESNNCQRS